MTATRLPGGEEMKYTEKIHAKRLLGMLNKKNPCMCCPAGHRYGSVTQHLTKWGSDYFEASPNYCIVCCEFVDCPVVIQKCPCDNFGEKEAIKQTWIALEEKGYLE